MELATLFAQSLGPNVSMFLPILVITVPVLAIALLAMGGRTLSGSCGGRNPDGSCGKCGRAAGEPEPEGACTP